MKQKSIVHRFSSAACVSALAFVVCAAGTALAQPGPNPSSPTQTSNVNVVNTPSVNVVTLPGVTVAGGSVNIGNSPTVTVGNTRHTPVPNQDVDHPARHPYTATCTADRSGSTNFCVPSPPPPANSETVIQSVSMLLNTFGSGTPRSAYVNGYSSSVLAAATYLPIVSQSGPSLGIYTIYQLTAIYIDPTAILQCNTDTANLAPDSILTCTVTGYYVTLP